MNECPFCKSETGYETKTVERLVTWCEWNGEAINTEMEWISGGKQYYCIDCEKIVTKFLKDNK